MGRVRWWVDNRPSVDLRASPILLGVGAGNELCVECGAGNIAGVDFTFEFMPGVQLAFLSVQLANQFRWVLHSILDCVVVLVFCISPPPFVPSWRSNIPSGNLEGDASRRGWGRSQTSSMGDPSSNSFSDRHGLSHHRECNIPRTPLQRTPHTVPSLRNNIGGFHSQVRRPRSQRAISSRRDRRVFHNRRFLFPNCILHSNDWYIPNICSRSGCGVDFARPADLLVAKGTGIVTFNRVTQEKELVLIRNVSYV